MLSMRLAHFVVVKGEIYFPVAQGRQQVVSCHLSTIYPWDYGIVGRDDSRLILYSYRHKHKYQLSFIELHLAGAAPHAVRMH